MLRRSASRATPTSRSRTRRTTCSRRSSSSCSGAASATSSGSRSRARRRRACSTRIQQRPGRRRRRDRSPCRDCSISPICTEFVDLPRPELKYEPWSGVTHPRFGRRRCGRSFAEIRRGDVLVHHPYDLVRDELRGVRACELREDPDVVGIKTTVYRTSDDSPLVPALIEAQRTGSSRSASSSSRRASTSIGTSSGRARSSSAGVHVVYGFSNLKIHAKTTLVVRREGDELQRYVHVGTGNYHARTARELRGLRPLHRRRGHRRGRRRPLQLPDRLRAPAEFRKILVAPFGLRRAAHRAHPRGRASSGKEGCAIRIKVNALTDPRDHRRALRRVGRRARRSTSSRAASARCGPGVPGSARRSASAACSAGSSSTAALFVFEPPGFATFLMGSADLMPRNLDHRDRGRRPRRGRARTAGDRPGLRRAARGQRRTLGARRRRPLDARAPRKGARSKPTQTVLMRNALARARRRLASRSR